MVPPSRAILAPLVVLGLAASMLSAAPAPAPAAGAADAAGRASADSLSTAELLAKAEALSRAKPPLKAVQVRFVRGRSGFSEPTDVESARDGTGRLFVTERAGTVRVVRKGGVARRPYLDLRTRVGSRGGEQGLLGIAFRPGFKKHRQVFVSYTTGDGVLRVSRFTVPRYRANHVAAKRERVVLTVPHPGASNHNGGGLVFGKGGKLFVSTGDGGGAGDPSNNAQSTSSLLGKILRIDVSRSCGQRRYCVPEDNPFVGESGARGEIWALGLRNPWRFSRDHRTGDLWIGDVGQSSQEEVDRLPTSARGANFGWSCREGTRVHDESRCRDGVRYRAPVFTYGTGNAGRSVIGGHVYRGKKHARLLRGRYLFTDAFSGTLWLHAPRTGRTKVVGSMPSGQMVTALGETGRREILAVTYDGTLWRMRASRR